MSLNRRLVSGFVDGLPQPSRRHGGDLLIVLFQHQHVRGILSMARLDDPASASSSFFIVLAPAPSLDGKYTVFGHVVDGLDVVQKIEAAPLNGEAPITRIDVSTVTVQKK